VIQYDVIDGVLAEIGEAPMWDSNGRCLWFVDIPVGAIYRYDPLSRSCEKRTVGLAIGAAIPRVDGGLVLALEDGIHLFDWDTATDEFALSIESDNPLIRLNDAKCDPRRRLWVGTMATDFRQGVSSLYRVGPDEAVPVLSGCSLPNGFGWSPDGLRMYFVDSIKRRIDVLDYDPETGKATERRPWVVVDEAMGYPDGITVDAEGCVWVALYGSGQVVRYDPSGTAIGTMQFPVQKVTSACFGGDDLDDLYVTSARFGLTPSELESQPLAGATFIVRDAGHGEQSIAWDASTLRRQREVTDLGGTRT
jgi:sugar lactone lactonase YvrE